VSVNGLLTVVLIAFILALTAIEAYCVRRGIPTISERLQRLGRSTPLVTVLVCLVLGALAIHFFGQSACVP
jgi:hypothetical protein